MVEQGSQAGRQWSTEEGTYTDEETGASIRQLTDSRSHDHHLYFHQNGWYDDGERLLFGSDRTGSPNLFSIELASGRITQLTDLPPAGGDGGPGEDYAFPFLIASINRHRPEVYFWYERRLVALDHEALTLRTLYELPADHFGSHANVTADGEAIFTTKVEDGGLERTNYHRDSEILLIPVDGGDPEVVHTEDVWCGHPNPSHTMANICQFSHQNPGEPWSEVDHKLWGVDLESGEVWKIRPSEYGGIGHQHWLANGEDIGYHGRTPEGEHMLGYCRYDNSEGRDVAAPPRSGHVHGLTPERFVGDGTYDAPYLYLYQFDEDAEGYEARRLARHGGSAHVQGIHVHPRFHPDPDAEQVLYTSDRKGYANVYLLDLPAFEDLPLAEAETE